MSLQWTEPHDNNAAIQGYIIYYMPVIFRETNVQNTSNVLSFFLTGLLPGMDYSIFVTAYNEIGESIRSELLLVRTQDEGIS